MKIISWNVNSVRARIENIKDYIKNHLENGLPIMTKQVEMEEEKESSKEETELISKIRVVLDDYVKPAVEQDGGAISFHSFKDGVVKVMLQERHGLVVS